MVVAPHVQVELRLILQAEEQPQVVLHPKQQVGMQPYLQRKPQAVLNWELDVMNWELTAPVMMRNYQQLD